MLKELPPSPKETFKYNLSSEAANKNFQDIVDNFYTAEAPEPTYERDRTPQEVLDLGKKAVETTLALEDRNTERRSRDSLKDDFENTTSEEMEAMSDEEILERFYRPDEIVREESTAQPDVRVAAPEPENAPLIPAAKPHLTLRAYTPPPFEYVTHSLEAPIDYSDIENKSIQSFAISANTMPGKPEATYRSTDLDPDELTLLNTAKDILRTNIADKQQNGEKVHTFDPNMPTITPNSLSDIEMDSLVDHLSKNRALILPIYKILFSLQNHLDTMPATPKKQEIVDQASFFSNIASRLMIQQAPGWDNNITGYLRRQLATEHEHLKF